MKIGSCHNNPVAFQNNIRRGSELMVVQVQKQHGKVAGEKISYRTKPKRTDLPHQFGANLILQTVEKWK